MSSLRFYSFLANAVLIYSCNVYKPVTGELVKEVDSTKINIQFQHRKEFHFSNAGIHFSNRFLSARANDIKAINDTTFAISTLPENSPINPAPWYAFKIWADVPKTVTLFLQSPGAPYRYPPKISFDNKSWIEIKNVSKGKDSSEAFFRLPVSQDTVIVASQPIQTSAMSYAWMESLIKAKQVNKHIIGYSLLNKPIVALTSKGSRGKKLIVVLSRQHPPEVTGYVAMQEFVRTLLGPTRDAQKFRKSYEVVVIPLLNPDGVDEGNWRYNAAGVDLNRDWEFFKQPETQAVKRFLEKKTAVQRAKVYFGIDFHSTWEDVFYTNTNTQTNTQELSTRWLADFKEDVPGMKVRPSGNGSNVSKSWMMRALGADALTYEVGDNTPPDLILRKGRIAAEKLMKLLIELANR